MFGLCKVEMSAFLGAREPHGRGADRVERERAVGVEGSARSRARASAAERWAGAAVAGTSSQGGGSRAGAWAARSSLESQDSRGPRAAQSAMAGVLGVGPDTRRRASGAARAAGEPGDAAEMDECRGAAAFAPPKVEAGACVAAAPSRLRRTSDDGQLAVPLAGRSRPPWSPDCHD